MDSLTLGFFARQLALGMRRGGSVQTIVRDFAEAIDDETTVNMLHELAIDVEAGKSLSGAIHERAELFQEPFPAMVDSGEKSNRLIEIMEHAGTYFRSLHQYRRGLGVSLIYPILVLVLVMIFIVSPTVISLVQGERNLISQEVSTLYQFGVKADHWPPHKVLEYLSGAFPWLFFLFIGCLVLFGIVARLALTQRWGLFILTRMPVIGKMFHERQAEIISRLTSLQIAGGINFCDALERSSHTAGMKPWMTAVRRFCQRIREGEDPVEILENQQMFTPFFSDLLASGLRRGRPGESLKYLADHYEHMNRGRREAVLSLSQPLALVLIGAIVLFYVWFLAVSVVTHLDFILIMSAWGF